MKKIVLLCALVLLFSITAANVFGSGSGQQPAAGGKLPITIGYWMQKVGGDPWGDFILEKFNVDLTMKFQDWSNYTDMFRIWAAADDLPDAFAGYPMQQTWFPEFVDQQLIRTIPYSMISKYPQTKRKVDNDRIFQESLKMYRDYYYLPRPLSIEGLRASDNSGIYYRSDWAEKLGFNEKPTDMDTFYQMIRAFTYDDPDGNGIRDTYGITGNLYTLYSFLNAYPNQWINSSNGRVIPGYLEESTMIPALQWLRRAYMEGVLDPELTTERTAVALKFTSGVFGSYVIVFDYTGTDALKQQLKDSNPGINMEHETIGAIAAMSPQRGGTRYHIPQPDGGGTAFSYNCSDAVMDKLLEIDDWLLSAEGQLFVNMGLKGTDWEQNPDGSYRMTYTEPINTRYASAYFGGFCAWLYDFNVTISPRVAERNKQLAIEWYREADTASLNSPVNLIAGWASSPERSAFTFDYNSKLAEIITGTGSVETMYQAFVAEANANGVQRVIDSINRVISR